MGISTKIEWTHSTFNPWWGCEKVSPGCTHCYAEAFAKRTGHPVWGGAAPRRFFGDKHWAEPLKWDREAKAAGERRRVFCASMADVFEDRRDLDAPRARLFELIERTPNLDWLLLTKRPENFARLRPEAWRYEVPDNVWRGVTVESPDYLWRIEALLDGPGGITFVSYEPAVAAVSFARYFGARVVEKSTRFRTLSWVIVGGESGPGARPFDVDWAREVVRDGAKFSVPVFVKQFGAKPIDKGASATATHFEPEECWPAAVCKRTPIYDERIRLADPKGGDWTEWPADLRVREFPKVKA